MTKLCSLHFALRILKLSEKLQGGSHLKNGEPPNVVRRAFGSGFRSFLLDPADSQAAIMHQEKKTVKKNLIIPTENCVVTAKVQFSKGNKAKLEKQMNIES